MKRISKIDTIHLSLSSKRKQKIEKKKKTLKIFHNRKIHPITIENRPIILVQRFRKRGAKARSKETKRNKKKKKGEKKNVGRPSGSRIDRNRVAEKRQQPTTASVENDRVRAASAGIRSRRCGCAELCDAILLYTVHNGPYLGRGVTATLARPPEGLQFLLLLKIAAISAPPILLSVYPLFFSFYFFLLSFFLFVFLSLLFFFLFSLLV